MVPFHRGSTSIQLRFYCEGFGISATLRMVAAPQKSKTSECCFLSYQKSSVLILFLVLQSPETKTATKQKLRGIHRIVRRRKKFDLRQTTYQLPFELFSISPMISSNSHFLVCRSKLFTTKTGSTNAVLTN